MSYAAIAAVTTGTIVFKIIVITNNSDFLKYAGPAGPDGRKL